MYVTPIKIRYMMYKITSIIQNTMTFKINTFKGE